jgi:RNA polymerase sigma-70 factor (ECF subfamily)
MGKEFNKIYEINKNAVYSYLYYMTKDTQDAEDLCQETFLKIYRGIKNYRG